MLNKQSISVSFAKGLDTKTDAKQVPIGNFLVLENSVFNKGGLLTKRNGFAQLSTLLNSDARYLTTFNGNLTAAGSTIDAYSTATNTWVSTGGIEPMEVKTLPLIRNSINQIQADAAVSANGLVLTTYTETDGTNTYHKYAIADATTGQNIVPPTLIPAGVGAITGGSRVFLLANYFILMFTNVIGGASHLQYIAISSFNPTMPGPAVDVATAYIPASTVSWDGVVANSYLYIAYNTTSGGQSIKLTALTSGLVLLAPIIFAGSIATMMTLAADIADPSNPIVYTSWYDYASSTGYSAVVDKNLNLITAPTQIIATGNYLNITSVAQAGQVGIYAEQYLLYSYNSLPTHLINAVAMTQGGAVGTPYTVVRSVGLASKAFQINGVIYFLAAYQSPYQPTYFLINGSYSSEQQPAVAGKLAYQNGGGYVTTGLPSVTVTNGNIAQMAYLYKDLIAAVNKGTAVPTGTQVAGIYSQTGINLGSFTIGIQGFDTAEIGGDLHLSGGFLWMYDGYLPVEHNFFLYPDSIEATWSATGGNIHAQPDGATNTDAYWYQVTYEWTDNQGNAFRSAPSIPVAVTTTSTGVIGSVTIDVPYLRLTYKTANPVKIVVYRWSVAQEIYYQVTSIAQPILNDTTTDYVTITDTLADATILGNNILYTTGGVVEDVNAPASNLFTLFDTRLWLVDAEDPNLLWFSKQVIEATPVEMSDLFTFYIAPTTAAQGSTGPITALSVMDDKLIIFKQNAIYYINGTGPDNTGANNQYSQPIFITSTVGCNNQQSIVFTQDGLMFQSDKGIYLLSRGVTASYIGAPVEAFNASLVESAINVPQTNQVRFTLNTGQTLMYDYYYQQWGTFVGIPGVSSCVFQGLHTFINTFGTVFQESPGIYVDGSNPVLMAFTTGPLRLGDLQGYQRSYFFYLLGEYISPHKLLMSITYDYASGPSQYTIITPTNFSPSAPSPFGVPTPFGAETNLESWRVFLTQQRCMATQVSMQEIYDSTMGPAAGAGLTLSGINFIAGFKKSFRPQAARHSAGGGSV
jgi:hypothetical protein